MIELMKYGYEHCDVVILEGIMYDEWYSPLFKKRQNEIVWNGYICVLF